MKIRAVRNVLFIKRHARESTTKGGLILAETAQAKSYRGTVVAAGPGVRTDSGVFIETLCKPGDVVLFRPDTGREVVVDGEELIVMTEDLILAKVEE